MMVDMKTSGSFDEVDERPECEFCGMFLDECVCDDPSGELEESDL